ncbi:hypothetical protein EDF56_11520 [Novosphingobium sp. PhB165]|uniref:hypothetical protein n=1 Tax=Novosphingobium sp. PhB165 TaxID=2485105 RepID=UPI00104C56D9|nr:hypothetical protein [Novosphingobium sp. PhB165]TCM13995.1 hypothetical protein EDF56_11520 [Novosphingobium sp. PhB165]
MADQNEHDLGEGVSAIIKGYAKRLAGELAPRPDLVVEGEKEQTEALRRIRKSRSAKPIGKKD